MKSFLKMLLASLLGGILLLFILFIVIASIASFADEKPKIQEASILKINVNKVINDRAQDNPFASLDPFSGRPESPMGLNKILASLQKAQSDDKIKGVYLEGGIPMTGNATLREMKSALKTFRDSGKFVYGYADVYSQKGLYLMGSADSSFVNSEGVLEWKGLNTSVTYLKEATEKLGLEPVVLRATGNKFKSAVEPFLRQDMSEANRMQLSTLLNSVWGTYLDEMSAELGITRNKLNTLADSLLTNPTLAVENGLLSGTLYRDELNALLREKSGLTEDQDINFVSVKEYAKTTDLDGDKGYSSDKIAVIYAEGEIVLGEGDGFTVGSSKTASAIRKARKNENVKAIVLRINSPGGNALASDIIWREVDLARQEKPVIASMGDVAASGGYYIACFADTILAQPNTITGSIGAFGIFFTGEELMNEKLGINIETVSTNKYSDLGTFDRDIKPAEKRKLINQVDRIYGTFKERVADGRGMTVQRVEELGQGRVYSGEDAMELKLVDMMGGLQDAIDLARNKAGLTEEYRIVEYPVLKDPIQQLIEDFGSSMETRILKRSLGNNYHHFNTVQDAVSKQGLKTRMEFDIVIE